MNPLNPNQLLRILENGYFMTHQEQSEAAQYIRQLQQENLTLLGRREWVGLTDEEIKGILDCGRGGLVDIKKAEQILKEKNSAL